MPDIEISVYSRNPQYHAKLRALLNQFEEQAGIHVNIRVLAPTNQWAELTKYGLYRHGPDISEVSTTRASNLAAMKGSRPFSQIDINRLEQDDPFATNYWETCRLYGDPQIWAVPWLGESYLIHYRRDLLEKAGLHPATAFQSHQAIDAAAAQLAAHGEDLPVELTMHYNRFALLHSLSSWVWTCGAEYCTQDGKRMLFNQPGFLDAARRYFSLLRHMSAEGRKLLATHSESLFLKGRSAITFGSPNLLNRRETAVPETRENWAVAGLPGEHFTGGSNLVIWQYTYQDEVCLMLIDYLNSRPVLQELLPCSNTIPTRLSILNAPEVQSDPFHRVMAESIRTGRSYPTGALWGMIGDQLANALQAVGMDLVHKPDSSLEAVLHDAIDPLTKRLNRTLTE
jgi:multiple sugar transport system substrate-binding protein